MVFKGAVGGPGKRKSLEADGSTWSIPPQTCHCTLHAGSLEQTVAPKQGLFIFFVFEGRFFLMFTFERQSASGGGAGREGDTDTEAGSRL